VLEDVAGADATDRVEVQHPADQVHEQRVSIQAVAVILLKGGR